jgi:carbon monoxide dehydrogenase subunit G
MKLQNEFTVPATVDQAFAVLLDVERVAPCLPGAVLDGGDGETFTGAMTIKVGPVKSRYQGSVRIERADESAHRAVMRAEARDARGQGTAAATITTVMRDVPEGTRVEVETDLRVSGPAARFGRGVMQDVSGKLMRRFADCLADEMRTGGDPVAAAGPAVDDVGPDGTARRPRDGSAPTQTAVLEYHETAVGRLPVGPAADAALAAAATASQPAAPRSARVRRSAEVLDLGAASRGAVLKRLVPAAAAALAAVIAIVVWRSKNS